MDLTIIRRRRRELKLTQQDLADLAGVSTRFLRELEQGKPSVQLKPFLAVLDALGLQADITTRTSTAQRGEEAR
ncbi:type II toxin-antitoxin system Y4mF family antitoxin [Microbacterium sp.]|uniref:type II toxin-antitoxin system Y4mF family antitoxin n=1 Tax=Microbacterium sp. TaxID=51671 RepID=UPI003A92AF44